MPHPSRQILFLQGAGEGTHDHWDDKLAASLSRALGPGHDLLYPRMPGEADPDAEAWSRAIADDLLRLRQGAVLVAHSIGGTIAIHTLARRPALAAPLAAVFLLAPPYVGEGGWPSDDLPAPPGWGKPLDGVAVHLFQGDEDQTTPPAHADLYAAALPQAKLHRLPRRDHQFGNDLTEVAAAIRAL